MKVVIDYERCSGHGRCFDLAPEIFTDDENGYGQVIADELDPAHLAAARQAVNSCPERAISLQE